MTRATVRIAAVSCLVPIAVIVMALRADPAFAGETGPAELLRAYVLGQRPWADVEVRNLVLSGEVPAGPPQRIVVEKGLPGRTVFAMKYDNGVSVRATADVSAFTRIVASARPLSKGRLLGEEDLCLVRMEVGHVPSGSFRDPGDVVGKTLTRSIGANLPVSERCLASSTLVKRGRKVTLVIESGGMRIAAAGEIRENARVNSVVRAINSASKRTVTGILVDENTVRVDQ